MALYRSGNSKLIEIKSDEFTLTFVGNEIDTKSVALGYNNDINSTTIIHGDIKENITIKILNDDKTLGINGVINSKPIFFENGSYQIILESDDKAYDFIHMESDISNTIQDYSKVLIGNIQFKSEVGNSTFAVRKNGNIILKITIEVFPTKLDYKTDYQNIMKEVDEEVSAIIFRLIGNTVIRAQLKETDNQTNTEFIKIFKAVFDDLEKDIRRICENLKHNVETVEQIRKVEKGRVPSRRTIDYLRKHPNTLTEDKNGFISLNNKRYLPNTIVDKRKRTTVDIYENQFAKYMITTIIKRLNIIEDNILSRYKDEKIYTNYIKEKKTILNNYVRRHFKDISDLKGKKTMSLVFQMSPGYKDLYIKYEILKKGLAIGEGLYEITPKKLYTLYEIWCYVKINNILKELGFKVKDRSLISYEDNGLFLSLIQEEKAKITYSNGEKSVELWYQKRYGDLPTTTAEPDNVLCIKNLDNKDNVVYIFDAKYRISAKDKIGPVEDDINVMHRYRDSIVAEMSKDNQFKYETFGAYVMFPYSKTEDEYKENIFYKSIEKVNIGAFPMLPGKTELIEEHIRKIVGQSKVEANNSRVLIDEFDYYNRFENKDVIVGVVPDKDHYDAYKNNRFYHIPSSQIKNQTVVGIKYLALYKPKASFSDVAGIYEYAKVKSIKLYKRKECIELDDTRGKGEEEYLRFELDDFRNINSIKPMEIGIRTHWYTTFYLLNNATNIHELKFKSNFEMKVYRKLEKIAKEMNVAIKMKTDGYEINGKLVVIDEESVKIDNENYDFEKLKSDIF